MKEIKKNFLEGDSPTLKTEKFRIEDSFKQIVTLKEMREIINHREKTGLKEFTEKYIDVGDSVIICNLTGNLDLNGQRGTIIDYRASSIN